VYLVESARSSPISPRERSEILGDFPEFLDHGLELARQHLGGFLHANQVNKRALLETDGLSLSDAHALEFFKNEGLAPDAAQRVAKFFAKIENER
jgi:hypothetical protein